MAGRGRRLPSQLFVWCERRRESQPFRWTLQDHANAVLEGIAGRGAVEGSGDYRATATGKQRRNGQSRLCAPE